MISGLRLAGKRIYMESTGWKNSAVLPFVSCAILLFLAGCRGMSAKSEPPPPPVVTISPSTATLQVGATQQFTANVPVNWSASCGTITSTGLYTAVPTPTNSTQTCIVTATPISGGGSPASVTVTIQSSTPPPVTVSPATVSLAEGAKQQFTANVPVNWSATCGSITSAGLYTAANRVGTCTVTAAAKDGSGNQGTATVTVSSPGVTISPKTVTLQVGMKQQFTADIPSTWTATCGTIDSNGLYTTPDTPQTCTITAAATDGSNSQATATASIILPPLAISPKTATLFVGATQQFTANAPVTWSASCGSIDNNGLYTAPNVAGNCTVTATDNSGNQTTATVKVKSSQPPPALSYTTWKNDNARTGQQRNETALTPANVNAAQFGIKFSDSVDGAIYAQPLYVPNLSIAGGTHNAVFVATEHDTVYAFDADAGGTALWRKNLVPSGEATVPQANVGSTVFPEVGITGTPVIDAGSGTLYLITETMDSAGTTYMFRLHAMDILTGNERPGSPVLATAPNFQTRKLMQRPGLLLANGNVYFALGSQGDLQPGWVFAYDAASLGQVAAWIDTPTGKFGGIWMAGSGIATDSAGNIYVSSGNGDWDGVNNFSMSFVKLDATLHVLDYFTPFNWQSLSAADKDLGSGGVLIVPDQPGVFSHEIIGCGKPAPVYVVDRDNMGHMNPTGDTQIIQSLPDAVGGGTTGTQAHCFTTPAFWEQNLYFIGVNDVIKAFHLDAQTGKLITSPTSQGTFVYPYPGAQPVVSSNGASNGIVWAVDHSNPTVLHAYDATDISREIYVSPSLGSGTKWSVPTIVNGNVYVGTGTRLFAFGLN